MNLLERYVLAELQLVKLHGEWLRWMAPNEQSEAKVELKLTPLTPNTTPARDYGLQARLSCVGLPKAERPEVEAFFHVEVILNAGYRDTLPEHLSFDEFSRHHTSLCRQLYPLLHAKAYEVLQLLGLAQFRLPPDLATLEAPLPPAPRLH